MGYRELVGVAVLQTHWEELPAEVAEVEVSVAVRAAAK